MFLTTSAIETILCADSGWVSRLGQRGQFKACRNKKPVSCPGKTLALAKTASGDIVSSNVRFAVLGCPLWSRDYVNNGLAAV